MSGSLLTGKAWAQVNAVWAWLRNVEIPNKERAVLLNRMTSDPDFDAAVRAAFAMGGKQAVRVLIKGLKP